MYDKRLYIIRATVINIRHHICIHVQVTRIDDRCFSIVLREGRNRQIRRMCERLGYFVRELHRTEVMGIGLGGLRGEGTWRPLSKKEMEMIHSAIEQYQQHQQQQQHDGVVEEEDEEE